MVGLSLPRPVLYQRIDERVEGMMRSGLEEEVRRLVAAGYGFDLPAMSGVGYGQFAPYLAGDAMLADVVGEIQRATRRFVRHQGNWFGDDDPRIHWFDASEGDPYPAVLRLVRGCLAPRPDEPEPGRLNLSLRTE
jgi:tRNA dimethylallyltransferase